MKRVLFILILLLCLTGCGVKTYTIGKNKVTLDQDIDFRHLHYTISNTFDFGSEKTYRFYDLYDKKPNVIYRVAIYQVTGNIDKMEDVAKPDEEGKRKYNGKTWNYMAYTVEGQKVHLYSRAYDEDEYYQIEFVNADKGKEFEKAFMKTVVMDTK